MKHIKVLVITSLLVAVACLHTVLQSDNVNAASKDANTFCTTKYPENSSGAIAAREACKKAYDTSLKSGTVASSKCDGSANKDACSAGATAGKAAKKVADDSNLASAKKTGTAGADSDKSKSKTCDKYHYEPNNTACEKAWEAQADARAKKIGEGAQSTDECKNLLGGDSAEKACKKAFTKAENERNGAGINSCSTVKTFFDFKCGGTDVKKGGNDNPIITIMLTALSWMTGLVALSVVGGIIYGGILYTTAQDNSGQTQKGIMFIVNSAMGLLIWMSAYALINFIVPGGLFHG